MRTRHWSLAVALALGAALVFLFLVTARPPRAQWRETKVFIPKGSTFPDIEKKLTDEGLLRYPLAFRVLVMATMSGTKLQHGEYAFPNPPSALELWEKVVNGDVAKYQVTIPDGSTIYDIADTLGSLELTDPDVFLATATSPEVARRLGIPGSTVEGYLFPDTYIFVKDMSAEEMLSVMVRRFRRKFSAQLASAAKRDGFTTNDIVTIASIIEKEAGIDAEKPIIAEVIRKRLALGMPLQMDPTVIYGLKKFGRRLTKRDLRSRNPYNTYRHRGLPPGPIANPGLASLEAAVRPAHTDYLYFVSRNDGSHQFSRTLREHNAAVAIYQRGAGESVARRGESSVAARAPARKSATPPPPR